MYVGNWQKAAVPDPTTTTTTASLQSSEPSSPAERPWHRPPVSSDWVFWFVELNLKGSTPFYISIYLNGAIRHGERDGHLLGAVWWMGHI